MIKDLTPKYLITVFAVLIVIAGIFMLLNIRKPIPTPSDGVRLQVYENKDYGFSFSYPSRNIFRLDAGYQYVTNNSLARVDLPASDFFGTNLSEASFIVGASGEQTTVEACLASSSEENATSSEIFINGTAMKVFNGIGVGAGNIYETKSYRAVKNGVCYEATLLLHSGNIGNYEPGTVRQFDREKFLNELAVILGTFKISEQIKNIIVNEPIANQTVGLPLAIKGQARVFENTFAYRIKNADGSLLLERSAMADSPDAGVFGRFSISINYPEPKSASGSVEIFEYSAKDGSEINKSIIPVIFAKTDAIKLSAYFPNSKNDPNMLDCAKVYAVERRVPRTAGTARAAIEELLLGPDRLEAEKGYITTLNSGVKINRLTIQDGIARIDFDALLGVGVAGSCRVTSIRAQIENTLGQFNTVESVVISIDGKTEEILQP